MDLISRKAAIDALAKFVPYAICDESTESYTNGLTDAYNLICQLPSVQTEKTQLSKEDATKGTTFDCISRQAAIGAAIDAVDDWDGGYNLSRADMIEKAINNLPSAQPEIIRCKDCKYWMRAYLSISGKHGCNVMRDYTAPDDYCFKAERKA